MEKDERIAWIIARVLLLAISIVFIVGLFLPHDCGVDKEYLSCRFTGSLPDIIGVLLFLGCTVWVSGLVKGISGLSLPAKFNGWNIVLFGGWVVGAVLIWVL
jgi:hypothetical protein